MLRLQSAVAILGLSLVALVVAAGAAAGRDLGSIRIAVEGPQSGPQASNGLDMLRGVQLAVREVNARGGVLGRRVEIVRVDDQAEPKIAAKVAREALAKGVVAVVGPYNSSVGIVNLPVYIEAGVVPVQMTSSDDTTGQGVTVQPKNSQIGPIEAAHISSIGGIKHVAMLVDPSAFTKGVANQVRTLLRAKGITVSTVPLQEGKVSYGAEVAKALASRPDLIYVSSYFPEGAKVAKALVATGTSARCLMGLANVDPAFIEDAGITASQACLFSGVPEAAQLPSARTYVRSYRSAFGREPGVWGAFTYDSAKVLFAAIRRAGTTSYDAVLSQLLALDGYRGATGSITIDPQTGNRVHVPVSIMRVTNDKTFVVIR